MKPDSVPALGRGYRLQWENAQNSHVLLYPEGLVTLNESAYAILSLIDGRRTVADVVEDLERRYESDEDMGPHVFEFLEEARDRGWLAIR